MKQILQLFIVNDHSNVDFIHFMLFCVQQFFD